MNTSTESKMTDMGRKLIKMREWLSDPSHWTQGTLYKDKQGHSVSADRIRSKEAIVACTCTLGAYDYTNGFLWLTSISTNTPISSEAKRDRDGFFRLMNYYTEKQPRSHYKISPITDWNDTPGRTHAEVLELLDHAIEQERLEAEASQ